MPRALRRDVGVQPRQHPRVVAASRATPRYEMPKPRCSQSARIALLRVAVGLEQHHRRRRRQRIDQRASAGLADDRLARPDDVVHGVMIGGMLAAGRSPRRTTSTIGGNACLAPGSPCHGCHAGSSMNARSAVPRWRRLRHVVDHDIERMRRTRELRQDRPVGPDAPPASVHDQPVVARGEGDRRRVGHGNLVDDPALRPSSRARPPRPRRRDRDAP